MTNYVQERLAEIRAKLQAGSSSSSVDRARYLSLVEDVPWLLEQLAELRDKNTWIEGIWGKAMTRVADYDELYVKKQQLQERVVERDKTIGDICAFLLHQSGMMLEEVEDPYQVTMEAVKRLQERVEELEATIENLYDEMAGA